MIGKTLGDYEMIRELGRGGMGVVYLAEHKRLKNRYAIKILPEELKKDEQFIQRFHVEAGVMARLDHPNVVRVHNMGREGDTYYIVMEYIHDEDGETRTLDDIIKEKKELSEQYIKDILLQVCDGLIYAHNYRDDQIKDGVIHRDVKPGNIFIRNGREVKISDFGLARIVGTEYLSSRIQESISSSIASKTLTGDKTSGAEAKKGESPSPTLTGGETQTPKPKYQKTSTGALLGTYDFMSPEQKRGEEVDKRSDIYALGVLIYKTLTRDLPTGSFQYPSEIRKNLSRKWDQIIRKSLRKEPKDRYQSINDIRNEIQGIGRGIRKRLAALAFSSVIVFFLLILFFSGKKEQRKTIESPRETIRQPLEKIQLTPIPTPTPSPSPTPEQSSPTPSPTPPQINLNFGEIPPRDLSWKESREFKITLNVNDPEGIGVDHYKWRLDGGDWNKHNMIAITLKDLHKGKCIFEAFAVDTKGGQSNTLRHEFTVNNIAPSIEWEKAPEEDAIIRVPPEYIFRVKAGDEDGKIESYCFLLDISDTPIQTEKGEYKLPEELAEGPHSVTAWVMDDAKEESVRRKRKFLLRKNHVPEISIKGPEGDVKWRDRGNVEFDISASDPDMNVKKIEWRINGGNWDEVNAGNKAHSFDKAGEYTVEAKAIDSDGLESTIQTVQFRITGDNPPILEAHLEKSEITEGDTTRLIIERAEDPEGGSVKLEYQIPGSPWQKVEQKTLELSSLSNQKLGDRNIELRATDEDQRETLKTLSLTIKAKTKDYTEDHAGLNLKMIWIPQGSFLMGSPESEKKRSSDEGPVHIVQLDGFWLGETEVTVGQFMKFIEETNYRTDAERGTEPNGQGAHILRSSVGDIRWDKSANWRNPGFEQNESHPVVCISWNDAKAFCEWLSKKGKGKYTLPTEAQWEYACRAGSTGRWCFGDDESQLGEYAWYDSNSEGKTHPVKQKKPNNFKLYDMHGNVWEWCSDWYGKEYYSGGRNPTGPDTGDDQFSILGINWAGGSRVLRGSSWYDSSWQGHTRSSIRLGYNPSNRGNYIGFRVSHLTR